MQTFHWIFGSVSTVVASDTVQAVDDVDALAKARACFPQWEKYDDEYSFVINPLSSVS